MKKATVLIPTHNNAQTLTYSLESVLRQTFNNFEIFIVGDGVPDLTKDIIAEYQKKEKRITFFEHPKGPRHGEIWRHQALQNATGDFVAYLSDDDLWMPDHLEQLATLLLKADFANSLTVCVKDTAEIYIYNGDLSLESSRRSVLAGHNFMPLSSVGHRLDFYQKLPYGWQTTPESTYSDLFMWQQFLSIPECRAISGNKPTVFNFPKSLRKEMSIEERSQELENYLNLIGDPIFEKKLYLKLIDFLVKTRVRELLGKI